MKKFLYLLAWLLPVYVSAQCFTTGTGNDGAYLASTNTTLASGTYNFTSFTINPGVVVSVTGSSSLIIYCTGTATIDGILSASGGNGANGITFSNAGIGGIGVAGGGNGGNGSYATGSGPFDGVAGSNTGGFGTFGSGWSGGGGAGYASNVNATGGTGGFAGVSYGANDLSGFWTGSGGGGGSGGYNCGAGGGGAGGGLIIINANAIVIGATGAIQSNGGNGGTDGTGNCGGGGAGSGGSLWLSASSISNDGIISAIGGVGGASNVPGNPYYGTGGNGSNGRIRVDGSVTGSGSVTPIVGYSGSLLSAVEDMIIPSCEGMNNGSASIVVSGGTGPYFYLWSNGFTDSSASSLSPMTYTCLITDQSGCTFNLQLVVPSISASTNTQTFELCDGESITVGISTYSSSGTYQDIIPNAAGCDSTITTYLTVAAPINTTVSINQSILEVAQSGAIYQWLDCNNNNAPISLATNQSYTPTLNGVYAVVVTVNVCSDTSICENYNLIGMNEITFSNIILYPNPTNGKCLIELNGVVFVSLLVTEASGRLIDAPLHILENQIEIDLSKEESGLYFLNLQTEAGFQLLKVSKQ